MWAGAGLLLINADSLVARGETFVPGRAWMFLEMEQREITYLIGKWKRQDHARVTVRAYPVGSFLSLQE